MTRIIIFLMFLFPPAAAAGPYYFITLRSGAEDTGQSHKVLREMVKLADTQHVRLTLLVSAQYAAYVSSDAARTIELETWKGTGHEIGAYHQGPETLDWDGYSDMTEAELARARSGSAAPGPALSHQAYFEALRPLNSGITAGCMMDRKDKKFLAAAPAYETCLAPANSLKAMTAKVDAGSDGINEFLASATGRGEGKKRLSCARPFDRAGMDAAKKAFSGMAAGVYGAAFNSSPSEFGAYFAWLKFLKGRDPQGLFSRTVSSIVYDKLLPDKKPQVAAVRGAEKQGPVPPAAQKTEIPRLQKTHNPYSQVERMLFGPERGGKQAQQRGSCGDGVCDAFEKAARGRCPRDCGR